MSNNATKLLAAAFTNLHGPAGTDIEDAFQSFVDGDYETGADVDFSEANLLDAIMLWHRKVARAADGRTIAELLTELNSRGGRITKLEAEVKRLQRRTNK